MTEPKFATALERELYTALAPFAALLDATERLGKPFPQTGEVWTIASSVGVRSITVEDMKAARAALDKARGEP